MKVHNFSERLAFSEKAGHEDFWASIYKKAFPNMVFHKLCTGWCQGQYLGIDRVIQLTSGKTIYVDEKKREQNYSDIFLEFISNDKTNSPGWMEKDLQIDYLAYAFLPSRRVYLIDWLMLKRAWKHFKDIWKQKYSPHIQAQNTGYRSIGVAVPIPELIKAVTRAGIIDL